MDGIRVPRRIGRKSLPIHSQSAAQAGSAPFGRRAKHQNLSSGEAHGLHLSEAARHGVRSGIRPEPARIPALKEWMNKPQRKKYLTGGSRVSREENPTRISLLPLRPPVHLFCVLRVICSLIA